MDCLNAVLSGLSNSSAKRLQSMQNALNKELHHWFKHPLSDNENPSV